MAQATRVRLDDEGTVCPWRHSHEPADGGAAMADWEEANYGSVDHPAEAEAATCAHCGDAGAIVDATGPEGVKDCPRCRP